MPMVPDIQSILLGHMVPEGYGEEAQKSGRKRIDQR